jgi:hypothetical protein
MIESNFYAKRDRKEKLFWMWALREGVPGDEKLTRSSKTIKEEFYYETKFI